MKTFKDILEESRGHKILAGKLASMDRIQRGVSRDDEKKDDVPFDADKPHAPSATAGKYGQGYSTARHLARMGLKTVTKEELELMEATEQAWWKKYKDNEKVNAHSENIVHVANLVGSDKDKKEASDILAAHKKAGHLTQDLGARRDALHKKLMPKVTKHFSESVELEEAMGKGEMTHSQLIKKIKDGTHEAMSDVKPGKHVEVRHTGTGKRSMVYVKHDTVKEESDLDESVAGQAKHLMKGVKRVLKGKDVPSDAQAKHQERSIKHNYASADASFAGNKAKSDAHSKQADRIQRGVSRDDKDEVPFEPDTPKKTPSATAGKYGQGYSTARHLARQGLKSVSEEEQIDEAPVTSRTKEQMTSPEVLDRKYSMYSHQTLKDLHAKGDWRAKRELAKRNTSEEEQMSEETEEQKKAKDDLDLKLKQWRNQQRAAKAMKNEEVDLNEGIVDTVRKANYNRLAKRSFDKAYDAHQDALDAPKTPAERRGARAEFTKQYDKGVARLKRAKEIGEEVDLNEAEMTHAQVMKKIKDGTHEAVTDVKPGKHVELRHTGTGKRKMVYVKPSTMKEETQGDTMSTMEQYLAAIEGKVDFRDALAEKTLTPAELKKREEIATAMERENPGMDKSKKMAIATATAKKVAEETLDEKAHTIPKTDKEKDLAKLAPPHDKITHADVMVGRGVKKEEMSSKEKMKRGLYNKEEVEQIDEADQPVSVTVHYKHKDGKTNSATHFTAKNAAEHEADVKKAGGTITGRTLNYASGKKEHRSMNEDIEQIDELSKNTLDSYLGKSIKDRDRHEDNIIDTPMGASKEQRASAQNSVQKLKQRKIGIALASKKLAKEEFVSEGMISYMDFRDKIDAHRKAGHKVVDDKYSKDKAHFTSIDKEGIGRKMTHTASGTKVENLGKVAKVNDDEDDSNETETRGRGRPAGSKSGARRH